jgi:peptide methionine sulfoxide reductase MsrB
VTATITDHLGQTLTGEVKCWMGRRVVEVETSDGARHIGHLRPDQPEPRGGQPRLSTVDGAA